jgi:hypothetical protein
MFGGMRRLKTFGVEHVEGNLLALILFGVLAIAFLVHLR